MFLSLNAPPSERVNHHNFTEKNRYIRKATLYSSENQQTNNNVYATCNAIFDAV
jgi:hypothetical protein